MNLDVLEAIQIPKHWPSEHTFTILKLDLSGFRIPTVLCNSQEEKSEKDLDGNFFCPASDGNFAEKRLPTILSPISYTTVAISDTT